MAYRLFVQASFDSEEFEEVCVPRYFSDSFFGMQDFVYPLSRRTNCLYHIYDEDGNYLGYIYDGFYCENEEE